MYILVLALACAAMAAPHRRSCVGDELLGGDACAAAQLDSIVDGRIDGFGATSVDNSVTDELISVFKSFAGSTATVNLSAAGSLASDTVQSMEDELSAEVSKSSSLQAQMVQSAGFRNSLEARLQSVETDLFATTASLSTQAAALSSALTAQASSMVIADQSLEDQSRFTARCVHGTPFFDGSVNQTICQCESSYFGLECDKVSTYVCDDNTDMFGANIFLAGVRYINNLTIVDGCPGHQLNLGATLSALGNVYITSTTIENLDNFVHVESVTKLVIRESCANLTSFSGIFNLKAFNEIEIFGTHAPKLELLKITDPWQSIKIWGTNILSLDFESQVYMPTALVRMSQNHQLQRITGFSGMTHATHINIDEHAKLEILDAFPRLTTVSGEMFGLHGLYITENKRIYKGNFLTLNGGQGVSGSKLKFFRNPYSYFLFQRIRPAGVTVSWDYVELSQSCSEQNSIPHDAGHPSTDTITGSLACDCLPGYSGVDCSTSANNITLDQNNFGWMERPGYRNVSYIREHTGTLEFHGLNGVDTPSNEVVAFGLYKVHELIFSNLNMNDGSEALKFTNLFRVDRLVLDDVSASTNALLWFPELQEIGELVIKDVGTLNQFHNGRNINISTIEITNLDLNSNYLDFSAAFGHLTTLDNLRLTNVDGLFDFSGFSTLEVITGELTVTECDELTLFDGFWSLTSANVVDVYNNTNLMGPLPLMPLTVGTAQWLEHRNAPCGGVDWTVC